MQHLLLSIQDIRDGIDGNAVEVNFIMQMGAGAAATVAHLGNDVTAFDRIPLFLQGFAEMGVPGDHAMAMINDNHITHRPFFTR